MIPSLIHTRLSTFGRTLLADNDHLLAATGPGALLLIHVPEGDYAFEQHALPEFIFCMHGQLDMETNDGQEVSASAGDMIEVTPGVRHRFAPSCNAVIVTLAQRPATA